MQLYFAGLIVSLLIVLFFAFGIKRPKVDQAEWHEYHGGWQTPVIDGQRVRGPVMRRKVNGAWEYRHMTVEELRDFENAWIW